MCKINFTEDQLKAIEKVCKEIKNDTGKPLPEGVVVYKDGKIYKLINKKWEEQK